MSRYYHYERAVRCSDHPGCYLWPFERCVATTGTGDRCKNRAGLASLYCPQSHGAATWAEAMSTLDLGEVVKATRAYVMADGSKEQRTVMIPLPGEDAWKAHYTRSGRTRREDPRAFRRGHPLEILHFDEKPKMSYLGDRSKGTVGVLGHRSMEMLTVWGPLGEEQIEVATEGAVGLDEFLAEVLGE